VDGLAFETEPPRIEPAATPSWQRRYTLGPGDKLNFSLYDRPDLARKDIAIAPDGTVSYLQAIGVKAQGRTIPELRKEIESALAAYHEKPQLVLSPAQISSKQFTVIGRVREPGSFQLTRPTTILEGIAAARGIEIGRVSEIVQEIADLDRSFVARYGRKLNVDLAKLYYEGDFSQNAYLEPNDYIYVASSLRNEIYVLGEVNNPGRYKLTSRLTAATAVSMAGGYNTDAFKQNVLLIRGSIHNPDTRVVKLRDILRGKSPDIVLQNRDILYVNKRPFYFVEDALDSAIFTFVQTVTAEAVNQGYNGNR
jgi:protein involved in polysaccharide export with SLBB domain